ncbi:MAG: hypothetical protein COW32_00525 [Candidatus Aquicultor secundus]|uniref:Peptidase U32 collagenase domain-containing protein n=1 Tax=Candidatus Aquicultor secundus TaxID=1973895 RepID=A0A2M7T5P0_9ACTN|nr:U32 family peptidase [Candidatus Aquicultor secundus]OIO85009.1 MAG: hypothetical protein AUK32_07890 [Candidatus Aquicultor secundus]PIU28059.1 MAG: hypothetical protein COT10_00310 [Candidatus Aquicultor secundus]PIW23219.1 MAG: hypothetical protein COW32_00525 [Candidatus Aquicultor secundus]PIX51319.1 MAG: hypothetical protein COZ51_10205 [Candidatus Aquicultor secundus]PIY38693.1 MAG: hypothetical protein COZ03_07730 [Candidatus Aquicultor secundus]
MVENRESEQLNNKLELLAPAGNRKAFDAALNSGADAIYLGVEKFSARRQAGNFTIDELKKAVRDAHLRGTKVYVAFNTIISDGELPSAIESLAEINNAGADAVIIQDWGVFKLVKRLLPDIRVHASTQMNTHNLEMVKFLEEQGANRITLARELSIGEIAEICDSTTVKIETFIHGALCFSYSGQCLFSSMVGNRSGNRGMCPQACRLGYSLSVAGSREEVWPTPGKHILSTKDLSGIKLLPELAKAGVKALKIEGRMKSPEYVATVVRVYRNAIDRYLRDPDTYSVSDEEINELKEVFSRGFTEGYFKDIRDSRLMSFDRPSDRGMLIGRVTYLDVYTGKLGLQLKHELCVGDEIEVWVSHGGRVKAKVDELLIADKRVECAPEGSKAVIVLKGKRHKINTGDRVFRIYNERLIKTARESITGAVSRRVPIEMSAFIEVGKPIELKAHVNPAYGGQRAEVTSDFNAEKGEKRTLCEHDVISQLNRLGNTIYEVDSWDITVGSGAMVPLGKLNDLRRTLVERLDTERVKAYRRTRVAPKKAQDELDAIMRPERTKKPQKPLLAADVSSPDQAVQAAQNGADWLYLRPGFLRQGGFDLAKLSEMAAEKGAKLALAIGNIIHQSEISALLALIESKRDYLDALLIDNFGIFRAVRDLGLPLFLDYHINNFNRVSTRFFRDSGASRICLSSELTLDQLAALSNSVDVETEALVHGWLEVMTAEHCVPSASKKSCEFCSMRDFYIEDQKGFKFPVEQDTRCRSHIYNSRELNMLPNTANLMRTGVGSLRLLLNRYEPEAAGAITRLYREAIDLITAGVDDVTPVLKKADRLFPAAETTTGHYFRAVQ